MSEAKKIVDHNFKRKNNASEFGWHSRGCLPHFDGGENSQFITCRLFDSMPQEILEQWRVEAENDVGFRRKIEHYLDSGYGECWLQRNEIAKVVQDSLLHHDAEKYKLIAWVIMPNHVHVLLTPLVDCHLPEILHSIKSYTAQEANKLLKRKGQFWQHESFDRYIRNLDHYTGVIRYIENNPVKAGLCRTPKEWLFGSAHSRMSD